MDCSGKQKNNTHRPIINTNGRSVIIQSILCGAVVFFLLLICVTSIQIMRVTLVYVSQLLQIINFYNVTGMHSLYAQLIILRVTE